MSGTTVELNLATAVDADDNADYLTISLANSLRTVDGLFNSVTGHTHGGAHQGGPVAIPDGSIQAVDIANGAVTNAKLASDTARANLLSNGGFEIWQRGAGPYTLTGLYNADRWITTITGTDTLSVARNTANADVGSAVCAACTFVLGNGAGATTLYQALMFADMTQLVGRSISGSMRVRTSTPNAVRVGLWNGSAYVFSAFHSGGGTYETLTVPNIAQSGAVGALQISFTASCTAYIDNAMLVVGSAPADYAPLHPADDLARCMRYYEKADVRNAQYGLAAEQLEWWQMWIVPKAISPTITMSGGANNINISPILATFQNYQAADFYGSVTVTGHCLMNPTYVAEANP